MRIRNNEEIPFEEAKQLLASRCGSETLDKAVDTLDRLLTQHIRLIPFKQTPQLREPLLTECAECGDATYPTGRLDLCRDCYDAI